MINNIVVKLDQNEIKWEGKIAVALAPVFVLSFPVVNLLVHHHYSFFSAEVQVLFLGLVAVGLAVGLLCMTHPLVKLVLLAVLGTLALTLQLDLTSTQSVGLLLAQAILGFLLLRQFSTAALVLFGTMAVTSVIQGSDNVREYTHIVPADPELPIYIHLILDGHVGIDGIPTDLEGGPKIKQDLTEFYAENGFQLYERAYSHYTSTVDSLLNMFNFSAEQPYYYGTMSSRLEVAHIFNRPLYFQMLQERGYALRIFHPQYLDYCSGNSGWVSFCHRYPSINLQSMEDTGFSIPERIEQMAQVLLRQSSVLGGFYERGQEKFAWPSVEQNKLPGSNPQLVEALRNDIEAHPRGYAYIVHLLSPHAPYVYNSDCEFETQRPYSETKSRDSVANGGVVGEDFLLQNGGNPPAKRQRRYTNYFDQIRCGMSWLQDIVTALEKAGVYDEAIVLVHSDHGSRLSTLPIASLWQQQLTEADYRDSYSSLFAIKAPQAAALASSFQPLEEILAQTANALLSTNVQIPKSSPFVFQMTGYDRTLHDRVEILEFISPVFGVDGLAQEE